MSHPTLPHQSQYRTSHLLLRSLLPSISSLAACAVTSGILVGLHIVLAGVNSASFLPSFLTAQGVEAYTRFIIQPAAGLLSSNGTNGILSVALWGLLGLVIYSIIEFAINAYSEWRATRQQISVVNDRVTAVRHPLERLVVVRVVWRLLIGACVVVLTISLGPALNYLLAGALHNSSSSAFAYKLGISFAVLTLLLHLYIVLLRLFMFRTRLFGEIIH